VSGYVAAGYVVILAALAVYAISLVVRERGARARLRGSSTATAPPAITAPAPVPAQVPAPEPPTALSSIDLPNPATTTP